MTEDNQASRFFSDMAANAEKMRKATQVIGQTKYDDERPETPEEIEEWIRRFREIEPIEMTPEEEAAWEADRKMQAEFDNSAERVRRIERIFE